MRLELNKALNMVIYQIHSLTNFEIDLDLASLGTGYFAVSFASVQHRKTDQTISRLYKMRSEQDQILSMITQQTFSRTKIIKSLLSWLRLALVTLLFY